MAFAVFSCLAAFSVESLLAVPASPDGVKVLQPDGSAFVLQVRGDEFFSWQETKEGYAVTKDRADGFWKYAEPIAGGAGFRPITGARVGKSDPVRFKLRRHAIPDVTAIRNRVSMQRALHGAPGVPLTADAGGGGRSARGVEELPREDETQRERPPRIPISGNTSARNIVILACFSDHWDGVGGTVLAANGRVATSEYANLFDEVGHTSDGAVGSVRDYYSEVSYGKFTLNTTVTPWVQLPQNEAYYGTNSEALADEMVTDAIAAADAAGFDFSTGDTDGDGWVDALSIIHSGYGEESTSVDAHIWSHAGGVSGVVTTDGVSMKRYQTSPALRSSSGTGIIRIGVICHELGHFFGLPDLYDYSSLTRGLGKWCLMASGSWNGSSGTRPSHFSAWCKVFLGFASPTIVHSTSGLSMARVEDNPVVMMIRDGMSDGEYFLLENRANIGFDNSPAEVFPGIAIYHVDSKSGNNDLGTWNHPVVKMEEADGNDSLGTPKAAGSQAGDVWTSTSGLTGGFKDQMGNTNTTAMLYQTGLMYARTNHASSYSYIRLSNFSAAGATMTCDAMTLQTAAGDQSVATPGYTVTWPASSEATHYEIQEGAQATLTSFSDGAEDEDAMVENWVVAGTVKPDSGGANSGTYSYSMLNSGAKVQSLTMRDSFEVTTATVVSYHVMSKLVSGNGYLKCQISSDDGDTWQTLATDDGYIDTWPQRSFNYAAINALGINDGEMCILRFVANFERGLGWSAFPSFGFAVDDISITDTEIAGHGSWSTLDNNVAATSYDVSGGSNSVHAYRVRAFANSTWQDYGPVGEVTVTLSGGGEPRGTKFDFK